MICSLSFPSPPNITSLFLSVVPMVSNRDGLQNIEPIWLPKAHACGPCRIGITPSIFPRLARAIHDEQQCSYDFKGITSPAKKILLFNYVLT
jgi:hypothetical protein